MASVRSPRPPLDSIPQPNGAAVFGLEIQNADSFFFWTFNPDRIWRSVWLGEGSGDEGVTIYCN